MISARKLLILFGISSAILLMIVMTYVIPVLFQGPSGKQHSKVAIPTAMPEESVKTDILIRPFRRTITRKGQTELQITAEEARINQKEKLFRLNAIKNITFYGDKGLKSVVSADEGTWRQDTQQVHLKGNIHCSIEQPGKEPLYLDCQWMTYISEKKILDGGGRVYMSYGPYRSEGDSIAINMEIDLITLDGRVISDILPDAFKTTRIRFEKGIRITARRLRYHHSRSFLEFTGNPVVTSGKDTLRAGYLAIELGNTKRLRARQGVVLNVMIPPSHAGPEAPIKITASEMELNAKAGDILFIGGVQAKQPDMVFSAEEIRFQADSDTNSIIHCFADGEVLFHKGDLSAMADKASYDFIDKQIILSGHAHVNLESGSKLNADIIQMFSDRQFYLAQNNVHIEYVPAEVRTPIPETPSPIETPQPSKRIAGIFSGMSPNEVLVVDCMNAELDEIAGKAYLTGNVRGHQGAYVFAADKVDISFDPRDGSLSNLMASGHFQLSQDQKTLTGETLEYDAKTGKATVTGEPLFWEGPHRIRATQFIYSDSPPVIEMVDDVDMVILVASASTSNNMLDSGTQEDRMHITADYGRYNETEGNADFKGNVTVTRDLWKITGDEMHLVMDKTTGDLQTATMAGHVTIHHEEFDATGETLTYSLEDSIIILTGSETEKCKVWKDKQGSQGDRITFFMQDNRFVIEKGMSVVMPKSMVEPQP